MRGSYDGMIPGGLIFAIFIDIHVAEDVEGVSELTRSELAGGS